MNHSPGRDRDATKTRRRHGEEAMTTRQVSVTAQTRVEGVGTLHFMQPG